MDEGPPKLIGVRALIVIADEVSDTQPDEDCVNKNLDEPALVPVTTPLFVMEATEGFSDDQTPPEVGLIVVVCPTHIFDEPVIAMAGFALTLIMAAATPEQPKLFVTVTL